jgi:hypothetical protein
VLASLADLPLAQLLDRFAATGPRA